MQRGRHRFVTLIWLNRLRQSIWCRYLTFLALLIRPVTLMWNAVTKTEILTRNTKNLRSLPGRYAHACAHSCSKTRIHCIHPWVGLEQTLSHRHSSKKHTHLDFSGRRFVSSAAVWTSISLHLWSHYLLTHLLSSRGFLFIFCKSPNQNWKEIS